VIVAIQLQAGPPSSSLNSYIEILTTALNIAQSCSATPEPDPNLDKGGGRRR